MEDDLSLSQEQCSFSSDCCVDRPTLQNHLSGEVSCLAGLFPQLGFCCAARGCVCSFQLCANDILDGVEDLIDGISHLPEPDKTLHPQDTEPQHNSGHGDEEGERSDALWNLKHQHLWDGKKIDLGIKHRQSTACCCFKG